MTPPADGAWSAIDRRTGAARRFSVSAAERRRCASSIGSDSVRQPADAPAVW
ncbi:hypothetical protein SAMN02787144_103830 [Streptomyces atratus]|uniref:Uncharacterized protein n=1 Tax=Streptomyces atratus TaxID=1893 RepID=A0A1K2F790_STRAR|nr:hypothetical protein SAMN02787144_103830 [Streptomyces atratus]